MELKCAHCQTNRPLYNMTQICCLARHVLNGFYPSIEARKSYPKQLASRYKVELKDLINAINETKGTKC